jgi:hypothetical protein
MIPLTERAAIYRSVAEPSKGPNVRVKKAVYASIPCQIVPVSSFDRMSAYSLESTHVIWTPAWLNLHKEDEVRVGRRTDPVSGIVATYIYVVNGRRRFRIGLQHRAFYTSERE